VNISNKRNCMSFGRMSATVCTGAIEITLSV
jgi:hypothetical protein